MLYSVIYSIRAITVNPIINFQVKILGTKRSMTISEKKIDGYMYFVCSGARVCMRGEVRG